MPRKETYTDWDTVPLIMDMKLAACLTGYNVDYLRQLAHKGKFPASKTSERKWIVVKERLKQWIMEHQITPDTDKEAR